MKNVFLIPLIAVLVAIIFQRLPICYAQSSGDSPPAAITIDYLSNVYGPVSFDHQLHTDYASCSECHHHTTGCLPSRANCATCHITGKKAASVACRSCHLRYQDRKEIMPDTAASSIYHIDIPGLKGAYHLSCIDCHEIIGTGPTKCSQCHTMTVSGKQFYQIHRAKDQKTASPALSGKKTE